MGLKPYCTIWVGINYDKLHTFNSELVCNFTELEDDYGIYLGDEVIGVGIVLLHLDCYEDFMTKSFRELQPSIIEAKQKLLDIIPNLGINTLLLDCHITIELS